MKINKQFNTLTLGECLYLLEHHRKYTDFNTLGLFRGIVESTKLSLEDKLRLRDQAIVAFRKPYEFLQLKDPVTYVALHTLGEELTEADKKQVWQDVSRNQQRILTRKKLGHRSFGIYSKHQCGYDGCYLQGLMVRQGSILLDGGEMWFCSDRRKGRYGGIQHKAERQKQERKSMKQLLAARESAE